MKEYNFDIEFSVTSESIPMVWKIDFSGSYNEEFDVSSRREPSRMFSLPQALHLDINLFFILNIFVSGNLHF